MNTLANHDFFPHDGRNITRKAAVAGLNAALNTDPSLASLMWDQAIIANPEPNATSFSLEHLNRHNILEHDASLSRLDAYYGNNHLFHPSTFAQTRSFWTAETVTAQMFANSKLARMIDSWAFNPEYTFTASNEDFSSGELASPVIAFGDIEADTVSRSSVEYFFEHERLPTALGWRVRSETMRLQTILRVSNVIRDATKLLTDEEEGNGVDGQLAWGGLHRRGRGGRTSTSCKGL